MKLGHFATQYALLPPPTQYGDGHVDTLKYAEHAGLHSPLTHEHAATEEHVACVVNPTHEAVHA